MLNTPPLVSVLMPAYNVAPYVEESVYSILNQTYKNIEFVIIDDDSTDGTFEKLQHLEKVDKRIKLYRNTFNQGLVKSLNFGLRKINGAYVLRMDADDISMNDRIQVLLDFLIANPVYDLVASSATGIDNEGKIIGETTFFSEQHILKRCLKYRTPAAHIWLAKTELYKNLNGYREITGAEDYDFLLRMTSLGFLYTNVSDYYGYYIRIRERNTNSKMGLKQYKSSRYVYKLYLERKKNGKDSFSKEEFCRQLQSSRFEIYLYSKGSKYLNRAVLNKKNPILFVLYSSLSLSISPYHIVYIYFALMPRLIHFYYKKIT